MKPIRVEHGDCLEVMRRLIADGLQVDSIITDPPYHLTSITKRLGKPGSAPIQHGTDGAYARASRGFMGQTWDGGRISFDPRTWQLALMLLKPGGHLLSFGGSRTWHRIAVAIEDAGAEIRDSLMWLYGSGFPKSHNQGGAWKGWGTALKPAFEPIVVAQRPFDSSVASNLARHGTGALNIDGCRVTTDEKIKATRNVALGSSSSGIYGSADKPGIYEQHAAGRWPANVIHDGSPEVLEAFAAYGERGGGGQNTDCRSRNRAGEFLAAATRGTTSYAAETGTAARFFYCAKASKKDRAGSKHPTVKPLALMRYLCRLVTPPGGIVLDPFAGSGTTLQAAVEEGFRGIGIEREAEYVADIQRRLAHVLGADTPLSQSHRSLP